MVIDNYDLWEAHDREQERQLARLPKCCCCGEPIQQEEAVCIDEDYYCEECEDEAWERLRNDNLKYIDYID